MTYSGHMTTNDAILTWTPVIDGEPLSIIFRTLPGAEQTERMLAHWIPPVRLTADPGQLAREFAIAKIAAGCPSVHLRPWPEGLVVVEASSDVPFDQERH